MYKFGGSNPPKPPNSPPNQNFAAPVQIGLLKIYLFSQQKMNWSLLVLCLWLACCQAAKIDASPQANIVQTEQKEKGFIEWISNLLGGSSTTTSPIIVDPPSSPKDCSPCQCGIPWTKRRIVGGHETKENKYPWIAVLLYNGNIFCGGSLINDYYIMTAAHCTGFRKDRITVRLLEHDLKGKGRNNETKTIDRKVAQIIRHQRYNPGTYDNDIALLKLNERIDLSHAIKKRSRDTEDTTTEAAKPETTTESEVATTTPATEEDDVRVRPVCLPSAGLSFTRECGVVIGWGVTEQGGSVSDKLQEVKVPIVSNKECRDRSYGRRITENMLCAGVPEGGRDACQGDSGGPLHVFNETSGKYQEVGVVSWGEGCAQPDKYGVYSRVNRYLTWIKSNTADACYCD